MEHVLSKSFHRKWYVSNNNSSSNLLKIYFIQDEDFIIREHGQFRIMLPFAQSECAVANLIDVQHLVNSDGDNEIKDVFELTLQIKVYLILEKSN